MVAAIKNHKSATNPAPHIKTPRLELVPQSMAYLKTTHAYSGDSENIASWKTMEKLGMKRVSCTGGRYNKIAPTEERKEFLYEMQEGTD